MFDQAFENLRKAAELNLQMQQEMFKKWTSLWPGVPGSPTTWTEPTQKFQKKWADFVGEVLKKQRQALEAEFSAGLKHLEESFRLEEAKDPEELRLKTLELWQKTFEYLRQTYETQLRDFQTAITQWTDLVTRGAA
jgi:arginyl-tRNA synthetase